MGLRTEVLPPLAEWNWRFEIVVVYEHRPFCDVDFEVDPASTGATATNGDGGESVATVWGSGMAADARFFAENKT